MTWIRGLASSDLILAEFLPTHLLEVRLVTFKDSLLRTLHLRWKGTVRKPPQVSEAVSWVLKVLGTLHANASTEVFQLVDVQQSLVFRSESVQPCDIRLRKAPSFS